METGRADLTIVRHGTRLKTGVFLILVVIGIGIFTRTRQTDQQGNRPLESRDPIARSSPRPDRGEPHWAETAEIVARELVDGGQANGKVVLTVHDRISAQPIAAARVWIWRVDGSVPAFESDSEGGVPLPELLPTERVRIAAEGYASVEGLALELLPQLGLADLLMVGLAPLGEILVRVLDEGGVAVPSAHVRIQPYDRSYSRVLHPTRDWPRFGSPGQPLEPGWVPGGTDANGELLVEDMPIEQDLIVLVSGPVIPAQVPVHIPAGATRLPVELHVSRGAVLRGRVVTGSGGPVGGVMVAIRPPLALIGLRQAEADGTYRFLAVPPGRYVLSVEGRNEFVEIEVSATEVHAPDLVLPVLVPIEGRITWGRDCRDPRLEQAVLASLGSFALVQAHTADGSIVKASYSPEGNFSLRVPEGPTRVIAGGRNRLPVLAEVQVEAPALDVLLKLDGFGALALSVDPALAESTFEAVFRAYEGGDSRTGWERGRRGQVEVDGRVHLPLIPPGRHDLRISFGTHGGAWFRGIELLSGCNDLGSITVGFGRIEVRETDGGRMRGGQHVIVARSLRDHECRAEVDSMGTARLEALLPGPYTVARLLTSRTNRDRDCPEVDVHAGQTLTLEGPCPTPPLGAVAGTVTFAGEAVESARLNLQRFGNSPSDFTTQIEWGQGGKFRFDEVPAGHWQLAVWPTHRVPSAALSYHSLVVEEGQETTVELVLPPGERSVEVFQDGRRLVDVEQVRLFFDGGSSVTIFQANEDGSLKVAVPHQDCIVQVILRGASRMSDDHGQDLAGYFARLPSGARPAEGPLRILLGGGLLRLEPPPGAAFSSIPIATLVELDGLTPFIGSLRPFAARTSGGGGAFAFPNLPEGATLEWKLTDLAAHSSGTRVRIEGGRVVELGGSSSTEASGR